MRSFQRKKTYDLRSCEELIDKYVNTYKGECEVIEEGCLGLGKILLHGAEGKKSIIITEIFVNSWTSTHTIRMYNKLPKKYN
jgi:hypothetical protein